MIKHYLVISKQNRRKNKTVKCIPIILHTILIIYLFYVLQDLVITIHFT